MLLYSISPTGVVLFYDDVLRISPNLASLDENEGKLIALYCDVDLPWGLAPDETRLGHARRLSYGGADIPDIKQKKYVNAINEFRSCQYSSKKELIRRYENQLAMNMRELDKKLTTKELKEVLGNNELITISLKQIQQEVIDEMDKKRVLKGKGSLSFIEELMLNRTEYNRVVTPKNKII